jgi:hypothetical protein
MVDGTLETSTTIKKNDFLDLGFGSAKGRGNGKEMERVNVHIQPECEMNGNENEMSNGQVRGIPFFLDEE